MPQPEKASRLRRRLRDVERRLTSLISSLVDERGPLVRGVLQLRGTRCGKPNCKCIEGELHSTAVLVVSKEGKRRDIYVPIADRPDLQRRSQRYRRFRQSRAELARLGTELLRLVDELLETLIDPYSPQRRKQARKRIRKRPKRPQ
jgi:hypothetical protein